jgi:transposase
VRRAERCQIEMRTLSLDQMLPLEHQARNIWAYVESLDLSPLYQKIQAVEGQPGRDHTDPRILLALWMFATSESVSSARRIAKLCTRDSAYQWICGGVSVNYHLLSDFRTEHVDILDELLTDTIATLLHQGLHQGLISLDVLAQDGMRVRASAGTSSFRRGETLEKCRQEAQQRVTELQAERESQADAAESSSRQQAARQRAAEDRARRVDRALEELVELQEKKEKRKKGDGKKGPRIDYRPRGSQHEDA